MIFDQFVEGIKFHNPKKKFTLGVPQYFKMLYSIGTSVKLFDIIFIKKLFNVAYLTDKEKSPGLDSLMRIKKAPSSLLDSNFSASARVMRP